MKYKFPLLIFLILIIFFVFLLYKRINYHQYNIKEIDNFLTDDECDYIINISKDKLSISHVYSSSEDVFSPNTRKSKQAWLNDNDVIINNISERVRKYTNTPNNYQESLQVVNYKIDDFFSPHYDACDGSPETCHRMNGDHGPRLFTLLIYLNDDFDGGETYFPVINKSIKPKKGKAVIFRNVDDNGVVIKESLHEGRPIKSGEKWIANKWIRIN